MYSLRLVFAESHIAAIYFLRATHSLDVPVKETGHHVSQRISDGLSLSIGAHSHVLLNLHHNALQSHYTYMCK